VQWDLVDDMIEAEGWVLVVLLRLSPIVPWNLLNIAMAMTRIHFLSFAIASAIGARRPEATIGMRPDANHGCPASCPSNPAITRWLFPGKLCRAQLTIVHLALLQRKALGSS